MQVQLLLQFQKLQIILIFLQTFNIEYLSGLITERLYLSL